MFLQLTKKYKVISLILIKDKTTYRSLTFSFRSEFYKYFNSYEKLPSMNFQDNLEKVKVLYVVLFFISIREITLYFLVNYKNMEHYFFFISVFLTSYFTNYIK